MYGIGGWLGIQTDRVQLAPRMVKALYHRGSDGCGIKSWPEATLVHTRLSIIDLSPAGAQVMGNQNGTTSCLGESILEKEGWIQSRRSASEMFESSLAKGDAPLQLWYIVVLELWKRFERSQAESKALPLICHSGCDCCPRNRTVAFMANDQAERTWE